MLRSRRVVVPVVVAVFASVTTPFAAVAEPVAPETVDEELPLAGAAAETVAPEQRAELPELLEEVAEVERELGIASEEPASPGRRTEPLEAPIDFTSVYVELPVEVEEVAARVSADGERWGDWVELEGYDPLDGPDVGSDEYAEPAGHVPSELLQADQARFVQLEVDEDVALEELTVRFLDTDGLNEGRVARFVRHLTPRIRPAEASTVPSWVQPRSAWGAAAPKKSPSVARDGVKQVVVHHTAGQNNLGDCDQGRIRSTIRNIQAYHQNANGWNDIGYNVVIDPCGGVWEGRAGGLDRAVIGAHAANFNTGSTGISVLGNFTTTTPNGPTLQALDRVVGWKAGIHGIDTTGRVTIRSASYPTVVGHRDVGQTACPGSIQSHLPRVRDNAAREAQRYPRVADGLGAASFSDISGNAHEAAIEELVERGITSGFADGTFRPQDQITRAQVASLLRNALDLEPVSGTRFSDVSASYVHSGAINALVDRGVLNGYGDGTFRPLEPLRRDHMGAILQRALELELHPAGADRFRDVTAYRGEIGAIADAGVTSGFADGTYRPSLTVTRGQMATFLVNALEHLEG